MKQKSYKKINNLLDKNKIAAYVALDWDRSSNPRCKFLPGDMAVVKNRRAKRFDSARQSKNRGMVGQVVAASMATDVTMTASNRKYTRYYLKFPNDVVIGYRSHMLA